jgi:hypothetical protein
MEVKDNRKTFVFNKHHITYSSYFILIKLLHFILFSQLKIISAKKTAKKRN